MPNSQHNYCVGYSPCGLRIFDIHPVMVKNVKQQVYKDNEAWFRIYQSVG